MSSQKSTPRAGDGLCAPCEQFAPPSIHKKHNAEKRRRPKYIARAISEMGMLSSPARKRAHISIWDDIDYEDFVTDQYGSFIPPSTPSSPSRAQITREDIPVTDGAI